MNALELFNKILPETLAAHPDEARALGGKFQLNIDGVGKWHVDLTGPTCVSGESPADCTLSTSADNFKKLVENPKGNAPFMYMTGKLKITGKVSLALKLAEVLKNYV